MQGVGRRQDDASGKPNKMATPKLELGTSLDDFVLWEKKWNIYKRTANLVNDQDICNQLTTCCSDKLTRDLFRSLGSFLETKTEQGVGG